MLEALMNCFKFLACLYESIRRAIVSSPGQSPGRAIVLPPVSVLASALALAAAALTKSLTLKFFM